MDSTKTLEVQMLGGFSIGCPGGPTRSDQSYRSKKVLCLLEYLIIHRERPMPQFELIDLLWPDEKVDDPVNTLKTLLHRVRAFLDELGFVPGKELIQVRRGVYLWNNSFSIRVDAEEFDALFHRLQDAESAQRGALLTQAMALYKGDFLPKNALEPWAAPLHARLHAQFLELVYAYAQEFSAQGRYDEVVEACRRAVAVAPYEDGLHIALINALNAAGQQQQALEHYHYVTELFLSKFSVNPSPAMTELYRELVKTSRASEMDLRLIRDELAEHEKLEGAFFCQYAFFKDIYRLNVREAARSGTVLCLALLTVKGGADGQLTQKQRNLAMERLMDVLNGSLRRGDVFTRYSVDQYLLMLPSASFENSKAVLDRVVRHFKQEYPHMNILLQDSALPAAPSF